jgi:aspartate aminotransferase-like enzyme
VNQSANALFTPGPVMMDPDIIAAGAVQIPYSRTEEFSAMMLRMEAALLSLLNAPKGSRAVFITGSGSAAMEAALLGFIKSDDTAAIIDGGTFGHRFAEICERYQIRHQRIQVDRDPLTDGVALRTISLPVAALLINAHETSNDHLYDLSMTAKFTRENNILHIVDAISLFGTDKIDMMDSNIDILIISSHKGMGLSPGLSMLLISPKAQACLVSQPKAHYLDVKAMLSDGQRGQTPFTPAIGVLLQLDARLAKLTRAKLDQECAHAKMLAQLFRERISELPLRAYSQHMPNAMTALELTDKTISARDVVKRLAQDYGLMVAPSGGKLADTVFRVSHMGKLDASDVDRLIAALKDILTSCGKGDGK